MANIRVKLADGRTGTMSEEEFTSGGWGAKGAKRLDGGVAAATAAPAPSPAPPKQYGKIETFLRNGLGGSLYGFGEEVASAIGAVPPVSAASGMPVKMPQGYEPPPISKTYSDLVEQRRLSAAQNPKTAALGEFTGAVAGSPMPGGPLAKGGSLLKSTARLAGRGAAASGVGAAGMTEGGIKERATAGVAAMPLGAVVSAAPGAVASGISRKPGSFQAPKLGYNPLSGAWANPESLKESAGAARISALRPTPSSLENINREFGSVEAFGRKINEAKNPITGAPLIKKNFDAPKMDRAFEATKARTGDSIRRAEKVADQTTSGIDVGTYEARVRGGPIAELRGNAWETSAAADTLDDRLTSVLDKHAPPNAAMPGGRPNVSIRSMQDIRNGARASAKNRGGYNQTSPLDADVGRGLSQAEGIAGGMIDDAMKQSLTPEAYAKFLADKDLHRIAARGDETVKAFRGAAGAPRSLSQVGEGAAASAVGGMVGGMPGAIAGRQAGFVLGHQSAINPAKAWNRQRLAEGIEGNGLHLGWDAAGAAVRGAQALPDRLIRGAGIMAGDEVAAVVEDPTRADLDFNDVRAKALRRFLLGE
jgi:hypothetical protein